MTATFLQSELSSLIQDAKKKYPEIKAAADKSLGDLKSLSITSETQLAGDLLRRPYFVDPFILACKSRNFKLAATGVLCLQRLTASKGVPRERLKDLLDAFRDVAISSLDIQLKILQTLPSLLQLYEEDLQGRLLAATLEVCGTLQSSKTAVVSGTAAATFQQLATTVFDRVEHDDRKQKAAKEEDLASSATSDAIKLFSDLCGVAKGEQPDFAQISAMSLPFLLEVIGSILTNHKAVFSHCPEMIEVCRTKLMPAMVKLLTSKLSFPLAVRVLRVIYILISRNLDAMGDECETAISTMVKLLEPEQNSMWKRVLCMEVIRAICSEAALLPRMFELFDQHEGKRGTIASLLAAFVRIASEDPSLIGLGRQSTVPSRRGGTENNNNDIMVDTGGIGGAIGNVLSADSTVTGISMEWSIARTPYMEQLDKSEPSDVPSTYIYSLIINCLVAIAEGLSKFVMPFSVPGKGQLHRSRDSEEERRLDDTVTQALSVVKIRLRTPAAQKHQRLLNPLSLEDHPRIGAIRVCADLITACWPAFLASCSTFLNSALDSTFYHNLVRAFQKMTQVSGVLELSTPRDAFLTTLGKAAIPINTYNLASLPIRDSVALPEGNFVDEKSLVQTPVSAAPRQSIDKNRPPLSIRNLLCMRALLNLGVALGPTLNLESWFIVIETLMRVEAVLTSVPKRLPSISAQAVVSEMDSEEVRTTLAVETAAVRTASKRMFESTRSYSDESFSIVVHALLKLPGASNADIYPMEPSSIVSPKVAAGGRREGHTRQGSRSMSSIWQNHREQEHEISFVLMKLNDLAKFNIHRFTSGASEPCSWDLVVEYLLDTVISYDRQNRLRLEAGRICNWIVVEAINLLKANDATNTDSARLHNRGLTTLFAQAERLDHTDSPSRQSDRLTDNEIHAGMLGALEAIIGESGEYIKTGWGTVFAVLRQSFQAEAVPHPDPATKSGPMGMVIRAWSPEILQGSFRSLQLIVSDFLTLLNLQSLAELTDVFLSFALQTEDLNISLTTSNFFGNVASLLQGTLATFELSSDLMESALTDVVRTGDDDDSAGALWVLLVLRLSNLCLDSRQDVRNSAMRVLFRILEASGPRQTPASWNALFPEIFFGCLQVYHDNSVAEDSDSLKWQSSVSQLLDGMADLIVRNIETIARDQTFPQTWGRLLTTLDLLLGKESLHVWAVVFATISRLLEALRGKNLASRTYAISALQLFLKHHPFEISEAFFEDKAEVQGGTRGSNQDAMVQHARVFTESYLMLKSNSELLSITGEIETAEVMKSLRTTIFGCSHPAYTSDIKNLAPEQEKVVAILPMLQDLMHQTRCKFTSFLLDFVKAALSRAMQVTGSSSGAKWAKQSQKPTLVAFSAKCVEILDSMISAFPDGDNVFLDLLVPASVEALAAVVSTKYAPGPQNADSPLWRAASRTTNNLVATTVRHIAHSHPNIPPAQIPRFFSAVTTAASAMLSATGLNSRTDPPGSQRIDDDETFDVDTFQSFHNSVVPTLGIPALPDEIVKSYVITLFHASFIANPWFFDIPDKLVDDPLKDFSTVRMGTVCAPVVLLRQKICYTALDALFGLVARVPSASADQNEVNETSEITQHRLRLATAAAPYLLLRIAHAFKTFMADQPLRSLTPLPWPLRIELLTVLTMCLELRSEDAAFTKLLKTGQLLNTAVLGDGKGHLRVLYPLLLRLQEKWAWCPRLAGGGAWQESAEGREIEEKMKEWGRVVAGDWV